MRKFRNIFRFIDNLLTVSDDNLFVNSFREIFPLELQLNLKGSGDNLNFLDLDLEKVKRKFEVKGMSFYFLFRFTSSNIPLSMFYSSVSVEILRIGRICSNTANFISSVKPVIERA